MSSSRQIWDISAPLNCGSMTYPGDTPYTHAWTSKINAQNAANVSAITLSPHVGTHADAPLHYDPQGEAIGQVDLSPYLGPCRVIHAIGCGAIIRGEHLTHAITPTLPARILVRTYERTPAQWDENFASFAPEALERLANLGVKLIGIDTPSIDSAQSKNLENHMLVRQRQLRILENLLLDEVPEGDYELIALPLKLTQVEASPVRAILRAW